MHRRPTKASSRRRKPSLALRLLGAAEAGVYSTARDYLKFLQMLLHGGAVGVRLLRPETVAEMGKNHTGNIPCGILKTQMPALSNRRGA